MAGFYKFSFISAVLLVIGLVPCQSKDCSQANVLECVTQNINYNDCSFYGRIVQCIEGFVGSCAAGQVKYYAQEQIDYANKTRNQCPGLPDGVCIFNKINECATDIPYALEYNYYGDDKDNAKKNDCKRLKSLSSKAKKCFQDAMPLCVADVSQQFSNEIKTIERMEKICASV